MKKTWFVSLFLVAAACGTPKTGPCDPDDFGGQCTVTEVASGPGTATVFRFTPTDGGEADGFQTALLDASGGDASMACSDAAGFTLGSVHACTLHAGGGSCAASATIHGYDPTTIPGCEN